MNIHTHIYLSQAQINSFELEREVKKYECCPEPYVSLQFKLKLQRRYRMTDQVRSKILFFIVTVATITKQFCLSDAESVYKNTSLNFKHSAIMLQFATVTM